VVRSIGPWNPQGCAGRCFGGMVSSVGLWDPQRIPGRCIGGGGGGVGGFALLVPGNHNLFLADILAGWFALLVPRIHKVCWQMLWQGSLC
jgi:hypothetical protein